MCHNSKTLKQDINVTWIAEQGKAVFRNTLRKPYKSLRFPTSAIHNAAGTGLEWLLQSDYEAAANNTIGVSCERRDEEC